MQDKHPISFKRWKFKPSEKKKSTYDKEMLAIMHALVKWKQYLFGEKFLVKTYHNRLKYFLTQKNLSPEQQKWVSKIKVFHFNILYKKGKENRVSNRLSRKYESDVSLCAISINGSWLDFRNPNWVCERPRDKEANWRSWKQQINKIQIFMGKIHIMVQTKNIFTQFIKIQNSSLKREPWLPYRGPCWFP